MPFPTDNPSVVLLNGDTVTIAELAVLLQQYIGGGSSIYDAIGDLAVGTGPDTAARLPVGADGQSLVADSAVPLIGVKWSTPSGTGDVTGPGVAVDSHVVVFNGTSGKAIKTSGQLITKTVTDHVALPDPHTQYALDTDLTAGLATKQPLDTQLTDLAALAYTANASKVLRVNAGATNWELATLAKGDVGLGSVDNTADASKNVATAVLAANSVEWAGAALTISASAPTGGADGDIWFKY